MIVCVLVLQLSENAWSFEDKKGGKFMIRVASNERDVRARFMSSSLRGRRNTRINREGGIQTTGRIDPHRVHLFRSPKV
jgi:hypothetical protein